MSRYPTPKIKLLAETSRDVPLPTNLMFVFGFNAFLLLAGLITLISIHPSSSSNPFTPAQQALMVASLLLWPIATMATIGTNRPISRPLILIGSVLFCSFVLSLALANLDGAALITTWILSAAFLLWNLFALFSLRNTRRYYQVLRGAYPRDQYNPHARTSDALINQIGVYLGLMVELSMIGIFVFIVWVFISGMP